MHRHMAIEMWALWPSVGASWPTWESLESRCFLLQSKTSLIGTLSPASRSVTEVFLILGINFMQYPYFTEVCHADIYRPIILTVP